MNAILKKLGLTDQNPVLIMNAPPEYKKVMAEIPAEIHTEINGKYKFIQLFAATMSEALRLGKEAVKVVDGDAHLWLCYPKKASKKYKSDIYRDNAADVFAPYDFEPVSLVAVDEDWSALRFRHVDNIKTMKRKFAVTEKGKEKAKGTENC